MARVELTQAALAELTELIETRRLPTDARSRARRSLEQLEQFPRSGGSLSGRYEGLRFILGPWRWMIILYDYSEAADAVSIVAFHDARSSRAATGRR